jgi:hypothetical protein
MLKFSDLVQHEVFKNLFGSGYAGLGGMPL